MKGVASAWLAIAVLASFVPTASGATPDSTFTERYWFGLLSRGPEWTPARTPHTDSIQAGHLANIGLMWKLGPLLVAGPFDSPGERRGVFIFRADSVETIRRLTADDPAIASERLELVLYEWWAPKGIGAAYRARAEAQPERKDSMVVTQLVFLKAAKNHAAKPKNYEELHRGHLENFKRLLASGKMPVGGPFTGAGDYRGVCVFTTGAEEARALMADDPLVHAGMLEIDMLPWWVADGAIMPGVVKPRKPAAATGAPAQKTAVLGTTPPPEPPMPTPVTEPPAAKAAPPAVIVAPPTSGARRPEFGEYVPIDELPEAISKVDAVYPEQAKRAGVSGTVLVQALVIEDGTVADHRIVKSIPELDEAAAAAVRQWHFLPAKSQGKPVAVWVAVPIKFGP